MLKKRGLKGDVFEVLLCWVDGLEVKLKEKNFVEEVLLILVMEIEVGVLSMRELFVDNILWVVKGFVVDFKIV